MIHLVCLSEGKGLPRCQHFRNTNTSNKFLNASGKIISAETLLDENIFVACLKRLHLYKVNQLRYGSLSQKYQGTSVQVLIAFNGIVFLLVKL